MISSNLFSGQSTSIIKEPSFAPAGFEDEAFEDEDDDYDPGEDEDK